MAPRLGADGGVSLSDAFEPPLRRVVDDVPDVRVVVPSRDPAVAHLHHGHEGMEDALAGVELPLLDMFEDHEIAFGHDVAGGGVLAGERVDAGLQTLDGRRRAA